LLAMFLFGSTIIIDITWFAVMDFLGMLVLKSIDYVHHLYIIIGTNLSEKQQARASVRERREAVQMQTKIQEKRIPPTISAPKKKPAVGQKVQREQQQTLFDDSPLEGELPPIKLLDPASKNPDKGYS